MVTRTCSDACRWKLRELEHPRQTALPLDPPTAPVLKLNPTVARGAAGKMQRACWKCLDRLERGQVFGKELEGIAGRRFGARLAELRPYLRALCGYNPGDKSINPILCADPKDGSDPLYMLAAWAEPANRPHSEGKASNR